MVISIFHDSLKHETSPSSMLPKSLSYDSREHVILPIPSLYGPPSVEPESTMIA